MTGARESPGGGPPPSAAQTLPEQACAAREGTCHSPRVQICPWQQVSGPQIQRRTPPVQPQSIYNLRTQSSGRESRLCAREANDLAAIIYLGLFPPCEMPQEAPVSLSFSPKKDGSGQNPRLCLSSRARPRVGVPMGTRGVRTSFLLIQTAFPNPPRAEKASLSSKVKSS